MVRRLKKYKNAGKIQTAEDFRHLARKLTHQCVDKERRGQTTNPDLEVTKEVKKKIGKLIDAYFEKLGGIYKSKA